MFLLTIESEPFSLIYYGKILAINTTFVKLTAVLTVPQ